MNLSPFAVLIVLGTISKFGNALLALALPILFLQEAQSPALALMALSVQAVPYLISPLLGEVVDRFDSRRVFFTAQLIMGACILLIPAVLHVPALVFTLLVLSGVGGVLNSLLNYYKLIPQLVPAEHLEKAIGTYMSVTDTAKLAGPFLGGLLVATLGARWAIVVDALTFFLMGFGTLFIVKSAPPKGSRPSRLKESLLEGWQYFSQSRDLKFLAGTMAVSNLGTGILDSVFITAFTELHRAPVTLTGTALTLGGAAAVLGSKVTYRVLPTGTFGQRVMVWQVIMLLAALILLLPSPWALTLGLCLGLFATAASNVITIAYRRHTIPEHLQGRVNANVRLFITGAIPLAGVLFGLVASRAGVAVSLWLVPLFSLLSLGMWVMYVAGSSRQSQPTSTPTVSAD